MLFTYTFRIQYAYVWIGSHVKVIYQLVLSCGFLQLLCNHINIIITFLTICVYVTHMCAYTYMQRLVA